MRHIHNRLAWFKKVTQSSAALLIFVLPLVFTIQWTYQIAEGSRDPRRVFGESEIGAFRTQDCGGQPDGAFEPFSDPIITVTFDDGWESIYSQGLRVLEACNIKSTQYILGDHFDERLYLSEDQVRSLQAAGHEIAGHSMTHPDLTRITEPELAWEVGESKSVLSGKFGTVQDFATPLGASNDLVLKYVKKHYRSHRNTVADVSVVTDEDINVRETFDRYHINAFTVRRNTTLDELKRLIDYTIQRKGWLVITYHQVDGENPSEYAVSPQVLETHLRLIRESNIRPATLGEVLDAMGQKER